MSFKEAFKKLKDSAEFKNFRKKNKKSFLFSAFFVLGPEFVPETQQFDYYLDEKSAATFMIKENVEIKIDEFHPVSKITPLDEKIKIDVGKLQGIIKKELEKAFPQGFETSKTIAILQKISDVQMWNITCLSSSLRILRMRVDCFSGKVLESAEARISDYIQMKK